MSKHLNILLVEDNPSDSLLFREMISEANPNIDVASVPDGLDALDFINKRENYENAERPDLVVLDLSLPRINGYQVLREMKESPLFNSIPVVILTTSENPLDRIHCEALGASKFLSKPHNLKGYEVLMKELSEEVIPALA